MKQLANMSDKNQQPQALPITRQDEIGQLISGFNRLLRILGQREEALHNSHEDLRRVLETTLDGYWRVDSQGNLLDVNPAYSKSPVTRAKSCLACVSPIWNRWKASSTP